jgi:hypothetical protein
MAYNNQRQEWLFSVTDVIKAITGSNNPRRYWCDLKRKLKRRGGRKYGRIIPVKLKAADGKYHFTDTANSNGLFRIIEAVPSVKVDCIKRWLKSAGRGNVEMLPYALAPLIRRSDDNMAFCLKDDGEASLREVFNDDKAETTDKVRSDNTCGAPTDTPVITYISPVYNRTDTQTSLYPRQAAFYSISANGAYIRGSPLRLTKAA